MARTKQAPRDCEPSSSSDTEFLLPLEAEADEYYPFDGQLISMEFGDDIEDSLFALQRVQWEKLERRSSTLLNSQQSTTLASRNNKKRAGSPLTKENLKLDNLGDMRNYSTILEENDLPQLLQLDSLEARKIMSLKTATKLAQGVQERIRDELRTKIGPVQISLEKEVTETEKKAKVWQAARNTNRKSLKEAEKAVLLARERLKGNEMRIVEMEEKLGEKKKTRVLMQRFSDGEELNEGEMEKVLVVCKGGVSQSDE